MLNLFILFSFYLISINGHGYLFEPIARSSAWLVDPSFKECCSYSGHMEMFCGGVGHQWNTNGGKCGICGEPYDRSVKLFEKGGKMYIGKIVKTYLQGQQIDVKIKLSANHQGYFEFRICNLDIDPISDATQECLDRHLLTIIDTNSTKYRDITKHGSDMINIRVQLSPDVSCQHCVFQWKYTTGNNWGRDPDTNKSGPGLGRENETFMGCSDITILPKKITTIRPPFIVFPKGNNSKTTRNKSPFKSTKFWSGPALKLWSILSTMVLPAPSKPTVTATTITYRSPIRLTVPSKPTATTTTITRRSPISLPAWSALLFAYERGDEVIYNNMKYRCVTSHRSYAGAEPSPLTWALWRKIE